MTSVAIPQSSPADSTRRELRDLYRILLLRNNASEFLVASDQPITLPCLEIPRWERVAEHLTVAVRKRYEVDAVCLFAPDLPAGSPRSEQPLYQAMHVRKENCPAPADTRWLVADASFDRSFADRQDCLALTQAIGQMHEFREGTVCGPFADPGWIDDLLTWAQRELDDYGLRLTGEFEQLNASPTFALLRLTTNGSAVWFKAVGEPNVREFGISVTLSKLFPGFVPTVIATRPDWNGWLATEFTATPLSELSNPSYWRLAARTLARLQVESIATSQQLLSCDCRDLRVQTLLRLVDPFLDVAERLMKEQPETPPPTLDRDELQTLGAQIKQTLEELAELEIPDALGNLDFNPGNILCSTDQCVFLDWAEAYVGPPLLTLEYLRQHLGRLRPGHVGLDIEAAQEYEAEWHSVVPPQKVCAAQERSSFLSVVGYAVGMEAWRNSALLQQPKTAAYIRSLTRRMFTEMRRLQERRHLCCH